MLKLIATAALAATALLAQAAPATYAVDPTHTVATFESLHFGTSTNRGRLGKTEGTVVFDKAGKAGKVDLTIDLSTLNTGVGPFDAHLKSKDFFDVANHPKARFVSDSLAFDGDKVREVSGQLTLRGKTAPVTLKAQRFNCYENPMLKREVCGGDFEAVVKRSAFGVNWGIDMGFADDTKVIIQVEAIKQ